MEHILRKVQDHGTGKEIRIPPEVCLRLGVKNGGEIQFDLEPGVDVVTLCRPGVSRIRQSKEQPKVPYAKNPEFEKLCR